MARLATADLQGRPHCVPVCFAHVAGRIWIGLDAKPKRVPGNRLRRWRNLEENPRATLLLDHYEEDWSRLWYLMVEGTASLGALPEEPLAALRAKYPAYRKMDLSEAICLTPERQVFWSGAPLHPLTERLE